MNIALVDMDQTLCDYEGAVKKKLAELYKKDISVDESKTNHRLEEYKPAVDLIKQLPGFWRTLPKIELGFQIVDVLEHNGFGIHVLTRGPHKNIIGWSEKVEWVREHLSGVPITITEDKSLVYGKILVDDWPKYCESWLKWRPRGLVLMPAYEYNIGMDTKHSGQVVRVTGKNWEEVKEAIKKVYEKPNET